MRGGGAADGESFDVLLSRLCEVGEGTQDVSLEACAGLEAGLGEGMVGRGAVDGGLGDFDTGSRLEEVVIEERRRRLSGQLGGDPIPRGGAQSLAHRLEPVRGGSVGDLLCRVVVETPVNLSKRQKELLEEFADTLGEGGKSHSPRQSSWFEGVKNFFDDMTS